MAEHVFDNLEASAQALQSRGRRPTQIMYPPRWQGRACGLGDQPVEASLRVP